VAASVTPWWKALKIRQEIISASGQIDDVQMSLFRAVHGIGTDRPPYADAAYMYSGSCARSCGHDPLRRSAVEDGGDFGYAVEVAVEEAAADGDRADEWVQREGFDGIGA
jgi:hypothetical protein